MATEIGKATIPVTYDAAKAEEDAKKNLVPGVKRIAEDAARVFAAAKIFQFGKEGFDELFEAQKVMSQTTAEIKATGGAANVTADDVAGLAGKLSDLSGVDDEVIQQGENMLLTFKAVRNEVGSGNDIFDQATQAALDLSSAGFGSMESASVMLGKALQDPVKGVTALQRVGVSLTETQKQQVAAFVASGDVLSAQKVILGEVEAQVGGTAAAFGEELPGKVQKAQNAMDEAKASLVGGMAPALELGANAATFLATEIAELPEPLQAVVGTTALLGGGIAAMARPVSDLINLFKVMRPVQIASAAAADADAAAQGADAAATTANAGAHGALSVASKAMAGVVGVGAVVALAAYGNSLNKTTISMEEVGNITKLTGEQSSHALDALQQASKGPFTELFPDALQKLADSGEAGIGVLRQYRDHLHGLGQDTTDVDEILSHSADAQKNLKTNVDAGATSLDDESAAMKNVEQSAKDLNTTLLGLVDGTISQFEAEISLSNAQINTRHSLDELAAAQKDGKTTQDDLTKAQNDAFSAILNEAKANEDLYTATHKTKDGTIDAAGAQQALVTELGGVADTLAPDSPLRQQIEAYIWNLAAIPTDVKTTAYAETEEAVRKIIEYQRMLAGIPGSANTSFDVDLGSNRRRAGGGAVGAFEPFRGAERGFEILLNNGMYQGPPSGGYVLRHDESEQFMQELVGAGARGGGNQYALTNGGTVIVNEPEDVSVGLQRLQLMNGG